MEKKGNGPAKTLKGGKEYVAGSGVGGVGSLFN